MKAFQRRVSDGDYGWWLRVLRMQPILAAISVTLLLLVLYAPILLASFRYILNAQVQVFNNRLHFWGNEIASSLNESAVIMQRLLQWREEGVVADWRSPASTGLLDDWRSFRPGALGAYTVEAGEPRLLWIAAEASTTVLIERAVAGRLPGLLRRTGDRREALRADYSGTAVGTVPNPVVVSDPFQVEDRWLAVIYGESDRLLEDGGAALLLVLDLDVYLAQLLPAASNADSMQVTIFNADGNRLLGPPTGENDYPCSHSLAIPGGQWRIDGVPNAGWLVWSSGLIGMIFFSGLSMSTVAGVLMFLYARSRQESVEILELSHQRLSEALEQRLSSERVRDQALADLARSRQLESVGRLAGGVAHEFNNLLQVILGHTDLLLGEFRLDQPVSNGLRQIDRAGRRAADLTKQLLLFSKREPQKSAVIEIVSAITDGLHLMKPALKKVTKLIWNAPEVQMFVPMDGLHFDQMILNLLLNADLAMPEGGEIQLRLREVAAGESAGLAGICESRSVVLTIADDGCGMSEEVLSRVFEPFFSTRGPSAGTGLGLSLVYSLMRQSGGRVDLSSVEGQGTTVTLVFPWCAG